MRQEDIAILSRPYDWSSGNPLTSGFVDRIGVKCPEIVALADSISLDLDEQHFGIGWWRSMPLDLQRRILISDYLLTVTRSVHVNIVEARLHILEAEGVWEQMTEQFRAHVRTSRGRELIPRPESPLDELPGKMGPVHVAGAMRALASSIDCLAGTVIGVIGLPTRIVRADWQRLWNSTKLAPNAQTRGRQQRVLEAIAALVTQAGPPGWLEWVLDTRNMLVHRGRRFHIFNVRGRAPGLIVTGNQAERIVAELVLPRDPQRTDADEWRAIGPVDSLLSESGSETLKGVFESTCKMVESIAQTLATVWQQRRDDSTFLLQPAEQWPEIVPTTQPVFVGYAAGSSPIDPRAITGDPEMGRRVMAAAVTDPARSVVWG